jgi:hypothetical protein
LYSVNNFSYKNFFLRTTISSRVHIEIASPTSTRQARITRIQECKEDIFLNSDLKTSKPRSLNFNLPFSTETRTIGLKSFKDSQQTSARDLPPYMLPSGGIRKFAFRSSSVTMWSSIKDKLPTPARTIFLQNYSIHKETIFSAWYGNALNKYHTKSYEWNSINIEEMMTLNAVQTQTLNE